MFQLGKKQNKKKQMILIKKKKNLDRNRGEYVLKNGLVGLFFNTIKWIMFMASRSKNIFFIEIYIL